MIFKMCTDNRYITKTIANVPGALEVPNTLKNLIPDENRPLISS